MVRLVGLADEDVSPPARKEPGLDATRFDRLTQSFGNHLSRRGVLRGLLRIALAGPLVLVGRTETEAKKKGHGNRNEGNSRRGGGGDHKKDN